ncbi:unnamed protein product, partial [Laminaria digitata]
TQIRGHKAGSSPPSPLRYMPSFLPTDCEGSSYFILKRDIISKRDIRDLQPRTPCKCSLSLLELGTDCLSLYVIPSHHIMCSGLIGSQATTTTYNHYVTQ